MHDYDHPIRKPEFCPNPDCLFHHRRPARRHAWYVRHGSFWTHARGWIKRFRCRSCGTTCSTQTFSIHYWTHSTNDLTWLLAELYTCSGLRQIGRLAGVTHQVIQNRCRRLARNALAVMDFTLSSLKLDEHLAMDGFESFTRSQYHPNNVTHITGCRSQFIYAAVHSLLRRKGAMTDAQKLQRARIDAIWKPSRSVGTECGAMLSDLCPSIDSACEGRREPLELRTDEHRAYPAAIRSVEALLQRLKEGSLVHKTTSSRAARTPQNPLFAVNYVDRQLRKNLAEYVRETVRQGREVNSQMERFSIFMLVHNFLTPHRISGRARVTDERTHAEEAGVAGPAVRYLLTRLTTHRHVYTHLHGVEWWIRRIWLHLHENPPAVRLKRGKTLIHQVCRGPGAVPRYLLV
jgi:hypothetical protein